MKTIAAVVPLLAALAAVCSVGHAQGLATPEETALAPVPLRGMAPALGAVPETSPSWMGNAERPALPIHSPGQASPWSFNLEGSGVGPRVMTLVGASAVQALIARPAYTVGFGLPPLTLRDPAFASGARTPTVFGRE